MVVARALWASDRVAMVLALVIGASLTWAAFASTGINDLGDGVQHHLFARYAWQHPHLFLDQWAKPLFTLLSSAFAQLGYPGMALFNALASIGATWAALPLLRRAGVFALVLFPVTTMLAPIAAHLIMDGMTEVLFGTMTVLSVSLIYQGKPVQGAIAASLTPLCRPEYVVFLPCVAMYLAIDRQWRSIPFLTLGILAYSIAGYAVYDDALSWWNRAPYPSDSVYGKGDAWHFIRQAPDAFGWPLAILFVAAVTVYAVPGLRSALEARTRRLLLCTTALPAIGIIAVHAYARATGTHGSAGFARVMVSALPLVALFSLFTAGVILAHRKVRHNSMIIGMASVALGTIGHLALHGPLVSAPNVVQKALNEACDLMRASVAPGSTVYATHPYVALRTHRDPFDEKEFALMWGTSRLDEQVKPGDHVLWESQFGPNEFGVPMGHLLNDTAYSIVAFIEPAEGHQVLGGHMYGVRVFKRAPSIRSSVLDTLYPAPSAGTMMTIRLDTIRCDAPDTWCGSSEFPWTADHVPLPDPEVLYDELLCTLHVHYPDGAGNGASLIYKQMNGEHQARYDERKLLEGMNSLAYVVPRASTQPDAQLYIWSPGSQRIDVSGLTIVRRRVKQTAL